MESVKDVDAKLFNGAVRGHLEEVVEALGQGGSVAVRGQGATPLLVAAQWGHTDICCLLLARGSDVNEMELKTKHTALHKAARAGHEALVEVLLSRGAIVDPREYTGATPLHGACQGGHLACVLTLLKAGASISVALNGLLPIHVAADSNRVEVVRTLLDYDCSPNMVSCCNNSFIIDNYNILSSFSWIVNQGTHHS